MSFSLNVLTVEQCDQSELECCFGFKTAKSKAIHGDVSEHLITLLLENLERKSGRTKTNLNEEQPILVY